MDRQQLLANKKILIIDPSEKIENDKTFCFWANQEDEIYRDYASIISHQWSSIQINESSPEPIAPLNYFHINAIDLYNKARALIQKFNITHELGHHRFGDLNFYWTGKRSDKFDSNLKQNTSVGYILCWLKVLLW